MLSSKFEIRHADESNVHLLQDWANEEHWNPGHDDMLSCFYRTDKTGFFLGYLGDEPIACISAVKHGDTFGFIGYYIVKPPFRGKGYGIQLFGKALEYLKGRNIGLDGVEEQQANYIKSGFRVHYLHIRFQGVGTGDVASNQIVPDEGGRISVVNPSDSALVDSIIKYDAQYFGCERPNFLKNWLDLPGNHAFCATSAEGVLEGFASIRPSANGYRIGPLYAETEGIASKLFNTLLSTVTAQDDVYMDVPAANPSAMALMEAHKWIKVETFGRMYTKGAPPVPHHSTYGIASLELG